MAASSSPSLFRYVVLAEGRVVPVVTIASAGAAAHKPVSPTLVIGSTVHLYMTLRWASGIFMPMGKLVLLLVQKTRRMQR